MAYRFVHAADIHLDSPLRSLALRNPDLAVLVANASRRAFVAIVDLCLSEQVDALLLAGDLYDSDQTSMKTARFLAAQLARLHQAGIEVFIIRGNHDALSKISRELILPPGVKLFDGRAEAIEIERPRGAFPVVMHGLSFAKPQAPSGLLPKYKAPVANAVNIGLMHTSLDGVSGHDIYAPCALKDLHNSGFHYWALGHIHKRAEYHDKNVVVMPGIPQGRDINEAGAKSVSLVTIQDDARISVQEIFTGAAQFERLSLDVSGIADWLELVGHISRKLEAMRSGCGAEELIIRLNLAGATPLNWRLRRDTDLLQNELEHRISAHCWLEKIEIECEPLAEQSGQTADPLAELRSLIDSQVLSTEGFRQNAAQIVDELRSLLPLESRNLFGKDEEAFHSLLKELSLRGTQDVLARLHAKTGEPD